MRTDTPILPPDADHALPHIASAFLRAGSCLERAQRHNATPLTPRQVSELCTFRLHRLTCASQPEVSQTKAVRAKVASPLGVLAPPALRAPLRWAGPRLAQHKAWRGG